jgi:16S rRNA (cytosine967-C5)-methyltransferase
MKLHPPLMNGIAHALKLIFQEGKYADKVIEQLLKSDKRWGSRDRTFLAENTYEAVRWWRLLWALSGEEPSFETDKLVRLTGVNLILKNKELPAWTEFEGLDSGSIFKKKKRLEKDRKVIQSIPDWLDETGSTELGENWDAELAALNRTADVVIRANTFKTNLSELKKSLAAEGWETDRTPLAPHALVLRERGNIFQTPLFKKGCFEVQDVGSQCIAPFLQVEPGMRVVDACAGAGGKSLHLAALMENKGSIIALDTEAWKLEELKKRARRNGAHIIQTRLVEGSKTIKRLHDSADRLLLDVPCTGLGTLRRNPDAKWKLSPEFLEKVQAVQASILDRYCRMLCPGGRMVYATCSILPSENERQVERFLSNNPGFKLADERKLSPAKDGFDGFYMAALTKNK